MAAGKWKVYETAKESIGDGLIDLDTHTFKMALFTSASNANTLSQNAYGGLSNEVANGDGYTTGGITLTGVTWAQVAGVATFTCDDAEWIASGSGITARFAVIYDDTASGDPLLCVCDLNGSDATATAGNAFGVIIDSDGVFTLSGANTD